MVSNEVIEVQDLAHDQIQAEAYSIPERPHVWIKTITFSDGTVLGLSRNEIVVFVGPNNAGKSAILKEAHARLTNGSNIPTRVASSIEFNFDGTPEKVEEWLTKTARLGQDGNYRLPMVGTFQRGTGQSIWHHRASHGLQMLANSMTVHLGTEARLTATYPIDLINFVTEVGTHPLHRLYDDDELESKLDKIFFRAFGQNLIVNRGAGRQVMLQVGERPQPPEGKDRQSNEFRTAVNQLPAVNDQGDGIRAFTGILASVLAADRDVIFIDEPEAFLHPPQATTLGRVLAEETPAESQLVVATHSTDFLRGVLDHSSPRVRVVRLQRDGNINYVRELSPETVRSVWADPLLRYSKVLDGLFHDGVIVCEGDADCRFYGAMLDSTSGDKPSPDLALVYGAGKSRIATIVRALRAIGVPVRVVVDFDVLSDEAGLKKLVEALGGEWPKIEGYWRTVKTAIEQRRAEIPLADARKEILTILDGVKGTTLSEHAIRQIREVLKKGSAWSEAKRMGKAFVPSGQQLAAYESLATVLRSIGLFLVEVGELEGFCRTIGGHGPAWVTEALERDLGNDPELAEARRFAELLRSDWPKVPSKV